MTRWFAAWTCACALALSSCSIDENANKSAKRCEVIRDCEAGEKCHDGYCISDGTSVVAPPDAGADEDGGSEIDGGHDAGPPPPKPCDAEGVEESCYSGPDGTQIVGICRAGLWTCTQGFFGPCINEIVPMRMELCNGLDDNCNGEPDELGNLGSCMTSMQGVCAEGRLLCENGEGICAIITTPGSEQCNGLDDDCDGPVDEGNIAQASCYPEGMAGCTDADEDGEYECMGVCREGAQQCVAGEIQPCSGAVTPIAEECVLVDGVAVDDNCNGQIDEDCPCSGSDTRDCYGGEAGTQDNPPCTVGTQTCSGGTWGGDCDGEVLPGDETCANMGVDNDCNGEDDNIPSFGTACNVEGAMGRCAVGTLQCVGSALTCVGPEPREESCDATDDDCTGVVDEGFDLQNDEATCGSCDNACVEGETCCSGQCANTNESEAHCGGCNQPCGSGLTCCGGSCVNLQNNANHCGRCAMACGAVSPCCKQGACAGLLGLGC